MNCSSRLKEGVFSVRVAEVIMHSSYRSRNLFGWNSPNRTFITFLIFNRIFLRIFLIKPIFTNSLIVAFMWQIWIFEWSISWWLLSLFSFLYDEYKKFNYLFGINIVNLLLETLYQHQKLF